jgi:hypothetical protein
VLGDKGGELSHSDSNKEKIRRKMNITYKIYGTPLKSEYK